MKSALGMDRGKLMRRSLNSLLHARRLYLIAKEDQRQGESDYAEFACSVAFKVCADAMEQALAGRLNEVLGKSYKEELGEKPRFDKLLDKFKVAIKPSLPGELEKALLGCREIRNDMTHHAHLPTPEEVEESFEVARMLFSGYCGVAVNYDSVRPTLPKSMRALTLGEGPVVDVQLSEKTSKQKIFSVAEPEVEGNSLRDGQLVEIRFLDPKPSRFWADPYCRIVGIFDSKGEVRHYDRFRAFVERHPVIEANGMEGLCIPTYDVPAEFREIMYVREPLWGSIKRHVVRKVFLEERRGKASKATIIKLRSRKEPAGGDRAEPIIACDVYVETLKREWKGYKALEDALSLGRFYKDPKIQECNAGDIRQFVGRELIKSQLIHKLLKADVIESRFYETEYVFRVFYGLVNRYRFLGTQSWARPESDAGF